MLETLIITLREGIEAALAVGIIVIYLRRHGRLDLVRVVHRGFWAALAASLAAALGLSEMGVGGEAAEGALMIAAAVLLVSMILWMARRGHALRGEIETKVGRLVAGNGGLAAAALFTLTFLMVFREGAETALLMAAVRVSTDSLLSLVGALLGVAIAVIFYLAFVRGAVLVDLARFFSVTSVVLSVFAAQLLLGGAHELGEAGILPLGRSEMRVLGPIVKGETLFLAALLTIPLILMLMPGRAVAPAAGGSGTPIGPERRRLLAKARGERRWRATAIGAGLMVAASLTGAHALSRLPQAVDPPRMIEPLSGQARVSISGLDDGHLHRFGVRVEETVVRFFVMRGAEGKLISSYDACRVCGADGYVEEKGRLVCIACAADIVPATVGVDGGCNPIPLPSRIEAGEMIIDLEDLRRMAEAFREAASREPRPPTGG